MWIAALLQGMTGKGHVKVKAAMLCLPDLRCVKLLKSKNTVSFSGLHQRALPPNLDRMIMISWRMTWCATMCTAS